MTNRQAISNTIRSTVPSKTSTGKKDCTFCKPEGFKFLPLRYAVVCGVDDAHVSMWPAMSYPLGEGVVDKAFVTSRYTVRMLREGFVYVLVERKAGQPRWQAYSVSAGGMLASFPVGNPPAVPPVFTCDLATDGVGASFVSIEKIDQVKSIHVLFSPDVLPMEMLDKRAKDKLGMQQLPPQSWQGHAHVLAAQDLHKWVAEFKLNTDGMDTVSASDPKKAGRAPFARQLFPLMGGPGERTADFDRHRQRLTALARQLGQMKSPALVLWDPIGITQELNFRHRSLDVQLQQAMKPHEWEMETSYRIMGLKQRVLSQAAVPPEKLPSDPLMAAKIGINPAYLDWQRDPQGWVKRKQDAAWGRYASCYDEAKRATTIKAVEEKLAPWFADVERRFADLKAWLTSRALTNAFEHYHPDNIECGLLFEYQASLCTYALATSEGGEAMLREWARDASVANTNLLNRQMLFNQKAAIDEFRKAAVALQGKATIDAASLQQMVSNVAGVIDKANAIAQMAEQGLLPAISAGVPAKLLSGALLFATVGQTALTRTNGAVDKLYAFVLYLRGGAVAFMQGSADAAIGVFNASYASKAHIPVAEAQAQRAALKQAMAANKSEFAAMRFGTALALIESWNLVLRYGAAQGKSPGSREHWDLYAACAATAAAVAVSVASLSKIVKPASAWFEHLTLTSGTLGGFAAGVVAVESAVDAVDALKNKRFFAFVALASKSVMNGVAAAGSIYVGVLYSGPLLQRVGTILGEKWLGKTATRAGTRIAEYAISETVIFGLKTTVRVGAEVVVGFIGWALIIEQVGELAILAVSDNKMQVWLTRCKFSKPKDGYRGLWGTIIHDKDAGKPYSSLDEEMKSFDVALKESL